MNRPVYGLGPPLPLAGEVDALERARRVGESLSSRPARFAETPPPQPSPAKSGRGSALPSPAQLARISRRLAERGVEMLQPRQHFLLQELQRVMPGLTLVLVVEAEHQQHAEAADLAPDLLDLFGDGGGRA